MIEEYYRIKEVARIFKVHPDTIRRWEKKGLIKPIRTAKNYRLFSKKELQRIMKPIK